MNRKYVPYLIILGAMVMLNLLNGRFGNIGSWIYNQLMMIPGIVIGLAFHEFAHGFVSHKLGDPTPKMQGRLTLNPASHIDPVGFLCLFFAGFGWGVPVQIDPRYYKHRRRDEFMVSIAGVVMNLLIALFFALILRLIVHSSSDFFVSQIGEIIVQILQYGVFYKPRSDDLQPASGTASRRLRHCYADIRSAKILVVRCGIPERDVYIARVDIL